MVIIIYCIFFFNDTATTEIYTLSLHDALPICSAPGRAEAHIHHCRTVRRCGDAINGSDEDRKSTRLNSSHANISYAVFCLKKKHHHPRRGAYLGLRYVVLGHGRHSSSVYAATT